jgi:hypothetical protein
MKKFIKTMIGAALAASIFMSCSNDSSNSSTPPVVEYVEVATTFAADQVNKTIKAWNRQEADGDWQHGTDPYNDAILLANELTVKKGDKFEVTVTIESPSKLYHGICNGLKNEKTEDLLDYEGGYWSDITSETTPITVTLKPTAKADGTAKAINFELPSPTNSDGKATFKNIKIVQKRAK